MKILVTAIGSMAGNAVIDSIRRLSVKPVVLGSDTNPKEWLWISKKVDMFFRVPKAVENSYVSTIYDICVKEGVNYIIPLTDPEVDALIPKRELFEKAGINIGISNSKSIENSRDKRKLFEIFVDSGTVRPIPTFFIQELKKQTNVFPVVGKPRKGRSSKGLHYFNTIHEIEDADLNQSSYIYQPRLEGVVYTVDIVRDANGKCVCIPREELKRSFNGAGLTVRVENNRELMYITEEVASKLNVIGCINAEFLYDGDTYYLMDVNPRFSAGVGFSKLGGYDMVTNHMNILMNKEIQIKFKIREGIFVKVYHETEI